MCASSAGDKGVVAAALAKARRVLLTTHVRPDGDGLGCLAGLHLAATAAGKECRVFVPDSVPRRYAFLFEANPPAFAAGGAPASESFPAMANWADMILVLDTSAFAQLEPIGEALKSFCSNVAVIDHHVTSDAMGRLGWRDPTAAATGVMVAELLAELKWPVTPQVAQALLTAVCTDTGWLRHSNTDARTLRTAAALVAAGARTDSLYARIYLCDRVQRMRLLAAALNSMEMFENERVAVITLTEDDFKRTGARGEETEDLVNEPLRIGSVEVSAILVDHDDGKTRVSLRSRQHVDVAAIAGRFGGGGHARAAGFRSGAGIAPVKEQLLTLVREALSK